MKKSILNLGRSINKTDQKLINGGIGGCDIAPPGCPCIVPSNHPCLNDGGGGGSDTGICFTSSGMISISCSSVCPDGTKPFCS